MGEDGMGALQAGEPGNYSGGKNGSRMETTTHDKNRCPGCGGGATHTITVNGKTILSERL